MSSSNQSSNLTNNSHSSVNPTSSEPSMNWEVAPLTEQRKRSSDELDDLSEPRPTRRARIDTSSDELEDSSRPRPSRSTTASPSPVRMLGRAGSRRRSPRFTSGQHAADAAQEARNNPTPTTGRRSRKDGQDDDETSPAKRQCLDPIETEVNTSQALSSTIGLESNPQSNISPVDGAPASDDTVAKIEESSESPESDEVKTGHIKKPDTTEPAEKPTPIEEPTVVVEAKIEPVVEELAPTEKPEATVEPESEPEPAPTPAPVAEDPVGAASDSQRNKRAAGSTPSSADVRKNRPAATLRPVNLRPSDVYGKKSKKSKKNQREQRALPYRRNPPNEFQHIIERLPYHRIAVLLHSTQDGALKPTANGTLARKYRVLGTVGHLYQVTIAATPSCDCPQGKEGKLCKHIVFVLSVHLRAPEPTVWQSAFLSSELKRMFDRAESAAAAAAPTHTSDGRPRGPITGETCGICKVELEEDSETVWCQNSCGANVHTDCIVEWFKHQNAADDAKFECPYCRAPYTMTGNILSGMIRFDRIRSGPHPKKYSQYWFKYHESGRNEYVNVSEMVGMHDVSNETVWGPRWLSIQTQLLEQHFGRPNRTHKNNYERLLAVGEQVQKRELKRQRNAAE